MVLFLEGRINSVILSLQMETSVAILLRRVKYSETSLIVTWLTRDGGKLKTMARGALRAKKNPFAGALDLFFETEIAFERSARSEIHALREVKLRDPFEGLRHLYRRVELAAYFTELLEVATEPEHPIPEIYDLLRRALAWLETAPLELLDARPLLHFENRVAQLLGVAVEGQSGAHALAKSLPRLPEARKRLLMK